MKTDNAGTYIIHDSEFRMLMSLASGKQYLSDAPRFLAFPCGLIRGALHTLQGLYFYYVDFYKKRVYILYVTYISVTAHVTVDVGSLPNAKFKIDVYRK